MRAKLAGLMMLVALIVLASYYPLSYAQQGQAPQQGQGMYSSCPQKLRVLDRRGELTDAQLFIGRPENKDELKRPRKQQQWVLAKLHRRAAAKKEGLFLQCLYRDVKDAGVMKASVTLAVPPFASACFIRKEGKGETRVRCE